MKNEKKELIKNFKILIEDLLDNYEKYTEEQCHEKGINDSIVHEDFMIGTEDMDITAILAGGREAPIFRGGNWAF